VAVGDGERVSLAVDVSVYGGSRFDGG